MAGASAKRCNVLNSHPHLTTSVLGQNPVGPEPRSRTSKLNGA